MEFGVEHRYVERCSSYDDAVLSAFEKDGQLVVRIGEVWVPVQVVCIEEEEAA